MWPLESDWLVDILALALIRWVILGMSLLCLCFPFHKMEIIIGFVLSDSCGDEMNYYS